LLGDVATNDRRQDEPTNCQRTNANNFDIGNCPRDSLLGKPMMPPPWKKENASRGDEENPAKGNKSKRQ